jgi:uncharacterized membrane protein
MEEKKRESWSKKLRAQFLAGLLIVVPIGASLLILYWLFISIDNILQPVVRYIFGQTIPGVGFVATVILIYVAGVIGRNYVGRKVMRFGDSLLARVPIFRQLYIGIRQIMQSFTSPEKTGFMQVVLVDFPREGMKALGFVTNEYTDNSGEKWLNVLIPTSPTPTSGFLQIVKEKDVVHTRIAVDEALKMIVSGGTINPENVRNKIDLSGPNAGKTGK